MAYKIFTQYLNGATGDSFTEHSRNATFKRFQDIVSNKDLRLTASAVVIESRRGDVYRHAMNTPEALPLPRFNDIPWPRRGRDEKVKDGMIVSAFIAKDEKDFVTKLGEGSFTQGLRQLVKASRELETTA